MENYNIKAKNEYYNIKSYAIPRYNENYSFKLNMNENTIGCSAKVIEALKRIPQEYISRYPSYGSLQEKIAHNLNIDPKKIMVSNGADGAIKALYNTYINKGDEVLYASPTYIMYKINAQLVDAKMISVSYRQKWQYPTDDIISSITNKTKLIAICSPNNPTGDLVPEEDICKIIEIAPHSMIIIDEAYYRFCDRDNKSLKYLVDKYDNLAIVHTFSKDYGLAGIRMGYLISQPQNIEQIHKAMDPFSVNNLAVYIAETALDDQEHVEKYLQEVKNSKKYVINKLKTISNEIYNSHTNFIWFNVGTRQKWYYKKLLNKGIKIRVYSYYPDLKGYIRLTLGTCDQMKIVLKEFMDYDAVVFDIDGVLVDETPSYRNAIRLTYNYFTGKEISLDKIQEFKNLRGFNNDWKLTKHLLELENICVDYNKIIEKFQEYYYKDGKGLISQEKLLINADYIKKLTKKYKLAIFTGRPKEEAEYILKKEGIYNCFDTIISMEDTLPDKEKPHPYGLNVICDRLGTKNILYIGDMPDDIKSARRANIDSIGVLPPQDKSESLKDLLFFHGAIEVYNDLETALKSIFREFEE